MVWRRRRRVGYVSTTAMSDGVGGERLRYRSVTESRIDIKSQRDL